MMCGIVYSCTTPPRPPPRHSHTVTLTFSLRRCIALLWGTLVLLCLGLGILAFGLYQVGTRAQVGEKTAQMEQAAGSLVQRYTQYRNTYPSGMNLDDATVQSELGLIANLILEKHTGVEGGFWQAGQGNLVYAFPTHEGDAPKKDVPAAELQRITSVVQQAQQLRAGKTLVYPGSGDTLILHAVWISGQPDNVVAWTMSRVHSDQSQAYSQYLLCLLLLVGAALFSGLWLMASLRAWSMRVGTVEQLLADSSAENIPSLPLTGEKELDRLIAALNQVTHRLKQSREQSEQLSRDLSRAERLAGLGRMAAGFAHELGNPIAAMRLRLDNARNHDGERQRTALMAVESQVKRLEQLLQRLFFLGKVSEIQPQKTKLRPWLEQVLDHLQPQAQRQSVRLKLELNLERDRADGVEHPETASDLTVQLDPSVLGRALENLLLNAIQHSPEGDVVLMQVHSDGKHLRFTVTDRGTGIPAEQRERIFEPFVSHRPMGMGLGLSLVSEAAAAHRGRVWLNESSNPAALADIKNSTADKSGGASFTLEIPWLKS